MTRPIGIVVPNNEPGGHDLLQSFPQRVEEWGYDSLWVTDHVVGVRAMEGVYGSYWLEALTTLTWAAARTSTIRLGTGILVLPHRDPVMAAKALATLDVLSGGRVDLGVGTGWSRTEFKSLGVERLYAPRGRASDEALDVMQACWSGGTVEHTGEFFDVRHIDFEPTPVQTTARRAGLPIWVGGHSAPALRRAARFADVWHPHDVPVAEFRELADRLDESAGRRVGRSIRLAVAEADLAGLGDTVDAYLDAGCVRVVLDFRSLSCDEVAKLAERTASDLLR